MSDYLSNARNFKIAGGNWSNVGRDQYNYYTTTDEAQSGLLMRGSDEEEAEFRQYHEVKRADVELHRSICSYKPGEIKYRLARYDCEKKFFAGEIARGNAQGSGLMIVGYEGPEAQEAWFEDFKRCTGFLSVNNARLLAISRSKIPLLIFARDLVPAAQFMANVGYLGMAYLDTMIHQLGCKIWNNIWMDPQRGTLCRGPEGPVVGWRWGCLYFHVDNVPSSVDLLQEDVCSRFLAGLKSKEVDRVFVKALDQPQSSDSTDLQFNQPTVVSTLTNTPIASASNRWRRRYGDGRVGVLLGNGQTRFAFDDLPTNISLESYTFMEPTHPSKAWLSQAWSVFRALGISSKDDLSQFKLTVPDIGLKLSLSQSKSKCERRRQGSPIFLFICPLPSTPLQSGSTSSFHYWSLKEDGHSPLSTAMCHYLGLPVALQLDLCYPFHYCWTNDVYKTLHEYQVARSFNPSTIDFARSIGHDVPVYKLIQIDSDRFEEVDGMEGRDLPYFPPCSPPVPYPSQISDESDVGTDDDCSDAGSDLFQRDASPFEYYYSSLEMDNLCTQFENMALV